MSIQQAALTEMAARAVGMIAVAKKRIDKGDLEGAKFVLHTLQLTFHPMDRGAFDVAVLERAKQIAAIEGETL